MFEPIFLIKDLIIQFWWTITPVVLFLFLLYLWMYYIQLSYEAQKSWTLLEVKLPREVLKTPKAMEQVFAALHGARAEINLVEQYIKGETQERFSLEIVGINGATHFYIRTNSKFRNMLEAQIYAQYPDAEIYEAEEYISAIPPDIPNKEYDIWGTELVLVKPDAYPIRTYVQFEEPKEEKRIDPLASCTELLSKLEQGAQIWIQFVVSPASFDWHKEGEALVSKILGKKEEKPKGMFGDIGDTMKPLFSLNMNVSQVQPQRSEPASKMMYLSPGERETVEAIEKNISKLGFYTTIRILYIARQEVFTKANVAGIFGIFRQFGASHLNSFKPGTRKSPSVDYLFKKTRNFARKRSLVRNYKTWRLDPHPFILNTEELATVYHFPGKMEAPAPFMQRVEAKKGEPPSGLPMG